MNKLAIVLIRIYQKILSPAIGSRCRFYPTCSEYSINAFSELGFIKALFLTVKRILKCNPLFAGGFDYPTKLNDKTQSLNKESLSWKKERF